jgi:hypothetical protein
MALPVFGQFFVLACQLFSFSWWKSRLLEKMSHGIHTNWSVSVSQSLEVTTPCTYACSWLFDLFPWRNGHTYWRVRSTLACAYAQQHKSKGGDEEQLGTVGTSLLPRINLLPARRRNHHASGRPCPTSSRMRLRALTSSGRHQHRFMSSTVC